MNVDDGEYGKLNNARTFCTPPLNDDNETWHANPQCAQNQVH